MKLIIKQYLASLKERGELDAILPELLSQLGLNVYSKPGRGTRQDGVDVAAVGSLQGGPEKVYLVSIKPGDLTRQSWDGDAVQSMRPSLNEILDSYIPNRLPSEHRGKEIVVCICCGGDVQEHVRTSVEGYIKQNTAPSISFEEWNGDRLAALIESGFLQEDLVPQDARALLRKSLAMLDEPDVSYKYFAELIRGLGQVQSGKESDCLRAMRQINLSTWILFAWGREAGNTESAYLGAELALLHSWHLARDFSERKGKTAEAMHTAFRSTLLVYRQIVHDYISRCVLPHVDKLHGLSSAINPGNYLDVNLRLFDVLGRLAVLGLWSLWDAMGCKPGQGQFKQACLDTLETCAVATAHLIANNPALGSPAKDEQGIDVFLALFMMSQVSSVEEPVGSWLDDMLGRCMFSYICELNYPCVLREYGDLLVHPKKGDEEYRREVTAGSILYPTIAFWAAKLGLGDVYKGVRAFKQQHLAHCNFQYWYPDGNSEALIYTDSAPHGAVLSNLDVSKPMSDFLTQLMAECDACRDFESLSAIKSGLWPIVLIACRHHRLPVPLGFFKDSTALPPGQELAQ